MTDDEEVASGHSPSGEDAAFETWLRELARGVRLEAAPPDQDARAPELSAGAAIDDIFTIERTLGEGGMGRVYLARQELLDRPVAVKLCIRRSTPQQTQRLLREGRATASLVHPNVVVVHHVGMTHGQVYIAMEYVGGGTLRSWLAAEPRGVPAILDAFTQAGRGLCAAHAKGIGDPQLGASASPPAEVEGADVQDL